MHLSATVASFSLVSNKRLENLLIPCVAITIHELGYAAVALSCIAD